MRADIRASVAAMLDRWAQAVEPCWYSLDDGSGLGCYGPGYIHWGVQSNFNYLAAMATLAGQGGGERWRARAIAALRFSLATHVSGERLGLDGKRWGHSWISMLGLERSMHGIAWLEPHLAPDDLAALRRVLVGEANWLLRDGHKGEQRGVVADVWNSSGRNVPESNIWSGALLWRVAQRYPDEPEAAAWAERAQAYLVNGVSVAADAADETPIAGRPVRERHAGANFFPHYALDHHGYLNVGYMVICASNAALLHFDMKRAGLERPAALDHHQADLWRVLRRMIFEDGRLARIGGDSRVRYAYCQEYLLPALLYAADVLRDPHALELAERQLALIRREMDAGGDGTFYGARLARLRESNPHYYTRLESDRACVLAMALNDWPLVEPPPPAQESFAISTAGGWCEPEHGAVLQRGPARLASFSWRAHSLTQAMCLPPGRSDLAEWSLNLCPVVRFLGDDGRQPAAHRRLLRQTITTFDGGFVTSGSVMEGVDVRIDEGASCTDQAITHMAFAALPDDRTCLGLQYVVTAADKSVYTVEVKGVHLNVPNDVFNGYTRRIRAAGGEQCLSAPPERDHVLDLHSRWANVDDVLGLVVLHGGERLVVDRAGERRGGQYRSLYVDELCAGVQLGPRRRSPGQVLVDVGFAVLSDADAQVTAECQGGPLDPALDGVRGVWVQGGDGRRYALVSNFGRVPQRIKVFDQPVELAPGQARLMKG